METYLGTKEKDGSVVSIEPGTRRKHMAIFGKSGTGKTTLLRNLIFSDLVAGNGITVVDPHGSLIDDVLTLIPRHRTNDIVYINPADPERVIGLNVLESVDRDQRSLVVSSLVSIMRTLFPLGWGPRSEWVMEHCIYALLEQPEPATLAALPKLLLDAAYRKEIVSNVTDPAVLSFFHFYEHQNPKLRDESISPLLNKVSRFVTNPIIRAVIGQAKSSFDFRWAMDHGKILLCSLSKGALGADVSSLLGSLIMTKLSLASLSRQNIPEADRRPHYLFADEIQNFTHGVDFPTILAEGRKYRIFLTIATQTLSQLPDESLAAVFGNCGTIASFRVSGDDAQALVREFAASGEEPRRLAEDMNDTVVPPTALQNLRDYKFYVRTLQDGKPQEPFLVQSFPPFQKQDFPRTGRCTYPDQVIRTSMERYGRDRKGVERMLNRFLMAG